MSEQLPDWHSLFPPTSLQEWAEQVAKTLKGKTPEALHWKPEPGLDLHAYYTSESVTLPKGWEDSLPGQFPFLRGSAKGKGGDGWQLIQEVNLDQVLAKKRIHDAKKAGVHAFRFTGSNALVDVWEKLRINEVAVHLAIQDAPILSTSDLKMVLAMQKVNQTALTGTLLNDPISAAAAKGQVLGEAAWIACEGGLKNMAGSPHFRSLGLDVSYVKQLGGAVVHELAFALGTVVEYLDQLGRMEYETEELLENIAITFSQGNRFFLELAKYRAFRLLYAQLVAAYGIEDTSLQTPFLMAQTTGRESVEDLPNHLIQATTQVLSAVLGGVNGIVAEEGESGDAARLARNIQYLLRHESGLHQVQDPAGGAYYVETLTHQLAQQAWKLFQTMEASEGFLANIRNGRVPGLMEAYRRLEKERGNVKGS